MTLQQDLLSWADTMERRDAALALHSVKETGAEFLARAKAVAIHLANKNGTVTCDEVRAVTGDPPPDTDPRIMGAIFRKGWRKVGYENSLRGVNNGRPVARFERVTTGARHDAA